MDKLNCIQPYATSMKSVSVNKKNENKQSSNEQSQSLPKSENKSEEILNGLELLAKQNMAGINGGINPADYLSPERIAEIETSMKKFEAGTNTQMAALENEFGYLPEFSQMSEAEKLAMAAQSFATL